MIEGKKIKLRPANLADRLLVFEWGHNSDIAGFIYPAGGEIQTFEEFCADYKEYYFSDVSPELGRGFIILEDENPIGFIAYNEIDQKSRVELDMWMSCEANCSKGFGPDAIEALCVYLAAEFGVHTYMMQPSAGNPRAIRAYEKAGFVMTPATPEQIRREWGAVDADDSVLMIRKASHTNSHPSLEDS
ncbi:MAG: GNAT family protein [Candidatus Thiodiazotropha sp.]